MISRLFTTACAFCVCSLLSSCSRQAKDRPQAVTIAVCQGSLAGVGRFTSRFGLSFDAPENAFTVKKVQRDMPPEVIYVFAPTVGTNARLVISPDDGDFRDLQVAYPTFSEDVGERTVQDSKGRSFGTDRWGYLENGERWRYVKFNTGDRAGYEPLPAKQADLLDQIVGSACQLPVPQTTQGTAIERLSKVGRFAFGLE